MPGRSSADCYFLQDAHVHNDVMRAVGMRSSIRIDGRANYASEGTLSGRANYVSTFLFTVSVMCLIYTTVRQ